MNNFNMVCNRQIMFGAGRAKDIAEQLTWNNKKKVFFATFSTQFDGFNRIADMLKGADIEITPYEISSEPDLNIIDHGRDVFLDNECDCTIALGGGSVIDAAKSINMLSANGGSVEEYQMSGRPVTKESPLFIAIPTTSGTGAEATKTAVVINNHNHLKKSLYHTSMIADIVILDPEMTIELPKRTTSATGMDALSHAIESYVSKDASPLTEMYGLKAISLINSNLKKAYDEPENIEARGAMMLASYLGGCAITAGIGIAHIMAQPLGGYCGIPHGDACSIFLPGSMLLNLPYAEKKYADIAKAMDVYNPNFSDCDNAIAAINRVIELQSQINAPKSLKNYIKEDYDLNELLDIIQRTTGHIKCNPKPLDQQLMFDAFNLGMNFKI